MEIQRGVAATLRVPGYGGDAITLSSPTVTVVRDSDGTVVVNEGATTKVTSPETFWKFDLAGSLIPECDLLTVTWKDASNTIVQYVEIVGGYACSIKAIKEKLDEDAEDLPADEEIVRQREIATRDLEDACWDAFRHRYAKETLSGDNGNTLVLSHRRVVKILSVTIDDVELSEAELGELALTNIGLDRTSSDWSGWPEGRNNIVIAYVYGHVNYPQSRGPVVDLAADRLIKHPTDWAGRATSAKDQEGNHYKLVTEGEKGARFSVPSANAFVQANEVTRII